MTSSLGEIELKTPTPCILCQGPLNRTDVTVIPNGKFVNLPYDTSISFQFECQHQRLLCQPCLMIALTKGECTPSSKPKGDKSIVVVLSDAKRSIRLGNMDHQFRCITCGILYHPVIATVVWEKPVVYRLRPILGQMEFAGGFFFPYFGSSSTKDWIRLFVHPLLKLHRLQAPHQFKLAQRLSEEMKQFATVGKPAPFLHVWMRACPCPFDNCDCCGFQPIVQGMDCLLSDEMRHALPLLSWFQFSEATLGPSVVPLSQPL